MIKEGEEKLVDKQVDEYEAALSQAIKDTTMQQVKRYGHANAMAISVSLARSFAASLAVLTSNFSEEEEKKIHNWFFECIKEEVLHLKEEALSTNLFEDLKDNKIPS
jgi:hypothetical protein